MNYKIKSLTMLFLLSATVFSCKKDSAKKEEPTSDKWTTVKDLYIGDAILSKFTKTGVDGRYAGDERDPTAYWFFSLDDGKVIPASEARTNKWDICIYPLNYQLTINNKKFAENRQPDSFFSEIKGDALITLVSTAFDQITTAPNDEDYNKRRDANEVVMPSRPKYTYLNNIVEGKFGDGWWTQPVYDAENFTAPQKPVPYTFIVKTNKGKYAKIQFLSFFKDSPATPNENSKKHYLTFRYVVQNDGSKNLDIK